MHEGIEYSQWLDSLEQEWNGGVWEVDPIRTDGNTLVKQDFDPRTGVTRQWRKDKRYEFRDPQQLLVITDIFASGLPRLTRYIHYLGFSYGSYSLQDQNQEDGTTRKLNYRRDRGRDDDLSVYIDLPGETDFSSVWLRYNQEGFIESVDLHYVPLMDQPVALYRYQELPVKLNTLMQIGRVRGFDILGGKFDIQKLEDFYQQDLEDPDLVVDDAHGILYTEGMLIDLREKADEGWTEETFVRASYFVYEVLESGLLFSPYIASGEEEEGFLLQMCMEIVRKLPKSFLEADDLSQLQIIGKVAESFIEDKLGYYYSALIRAGNFTTSVDFSDEKPNKISIEPKGVDIFEQDLEINQPIQYDGWKYKMEDLGNGEWRLVAENIRDDQKTFAVTFQGKVDIAKFGGIVTTEQRTGWEKASNFIKTHLTHQFTRKVAQEPQSIQGIEETLQVQIVESGSAFSIPSIDFTQPISEDKDKITVNRLYFSAGKGIRGNIDVSLNKQVFSPNSYIPIRTPAGSLRVSYMGEDAPGELVIEDGKRLTPESQGDEQRRWVKDDLPVLIEPTIYVPRKFFHTFFIGSRKPLELYMRYGDSIFKSNLRYRDTDLDASSDMVRLHGERWIDMDAEDSCEVYFPQDLKAIKEIEFIINYDS